MADKLTYATLIATIKSNATIMAELTEDEKSKLDDLEKQVSKKKSKAMSDKDKALLNDISVVLSNHNGLSVSEICSKLPLDSEGNAISTQKVTPMLKKIDNIGVRKEGKKTIYYIDVPTTDVTE